MFVEKPASKKSLAMRKKVEGVGLNDADYITGYQVDGKLVECPYYKSWRGMLRRCYNETEHKRKPTYKGCSVDPRWHKFSDFKKWMKKQYWKGKQLDKDLILKGNKVYGPDTCIFVSAQVNSLLLDCSSTRGEYPIGVSYHRGSKKYQAGCRVNGRMKYLGTFNTPEEAHKAYVTFKVSYIKEVAVKEEPMIKKVLLEHADLLEQSLESTESV